MEAGMAHWPGSGRIACCANGGGLMDMSMDGSPIIDKTPDDSLYSIAAGATARHQGWTHRLPAGASRT
jgi:hypothetical protein